MKIYPLGLRVGNPPLETLLWVTWKESELGLRRRFGLLLASILAATGITTGISQPASAADAYISVYEVWINGCPSGYVCLSFDSQNQYDGYGFYYDVWNIGTIPSPYRNINNNASSAKNSGTGSIGNTKFYDVAGGSGTSRCLRKGYSASSLGVLDNKTSAVVWASSCGSVPYF